MADSRRNTNRTDPAAGGGGGGAGAGGRLGGPGFGRALPGDRSDVDKVKDSTDIVRLVGEHLKLTPAGREFKCLCPFHDDHNPSMMVVPAKQIFKCFVCGAAGDALGFVMKFHKMEFREALEFLAQRAGITLQRRGPAEGAASGAYSREDLRRANDTATEFFRTILNHPEHGEAARALVAKRGISPDMVSKFQIGAAPDRWDGLAITVASRRLDPAVFEQAGLVRAREHGQGHFDMLRNRLIFPIQDRAGRVVAFGGRRINDEDNPKYLNSPETRLFKKSQTLYALNLASREIQRTRTAVITEGYMDVIACHQAGFTNAVATLGTALTREHATELARLCEKIVLLFDGDEAGQRAADRSVEIFFAAPLDVRIATLGRFTDAKDPDELLKRAEGDAVFRRVLDESADLLEFRFARLRARLAGAGLSALSNAVDAEIATLVELGLRDVPVVRQTLIVKRLAELAGVDEATIRRAIPAGRSPRAVVRADFANETPANGVPTEGDLAGSDADADGGGTDGAAGQPETPAQEVLPLLASGTLSLREHLLACVLCDGDLWMTMPSADRDLVGPGGYRFSLLSRVARVVVAVGERGVVPDLTNILRETEDESVRAAAVGLMSRVDVETDRDPQRLSEHWHACLNAARRERAAANADTDATALLERIQVKRSVHSELGKNPKVLPRPGASGKPGGPGRPGG